MTTFWTFTIPSSNHRLHILVDADHHSPNAVWHDAKKNKGWTKESFHRERCQFARIKLKRNGYDVTLYPTLSAAAKAHRQNLSRPA